MKARVTVLLFLGSVFLAVASVGLAYSEERNSGYRVCVKRCAFKNDASYLACHARCKLTNGREEKEEAAERDRRLRPWQPRETEPEREEESEGGSDRGREKEQDRPHRRPEGKRRPQEGEEGGQPEPEPARQNPYYIPSSKFQTRFENDNGRIRVLERFDKLSQHLQYLRDYRIAQYNAKPGTVLLPHHSDAEFLIIITKGRATAIIVRSPPNSPAIPHPVVLNQYDVLRVPAGAVSYIVNLGGPNHNEELELIKLARPVNFPGQFEDMYPAGNYTPTSFYKVFNQNTLQAAFNAPYVEIKNALWGPEQWREDVILKLPQKQLRSLIRRAQSSSQREERSPLTPIGPVRLTHIEPRYSNNYGSFHEAYPLQEYPPLEYMGVGASYLNLSQGSMFVPHFNIRATVLAFVANGKGLNELGSPYPLNERQQQAEEEGYIERLAANVTSNDLYVIPAGNPVAISALKNSNLEVVEFILNAPGNSRMFLAGDEDNVVKNIEPLMLSRDPERVQRLLDRQRKSFFVNREHQPKKSPRTGK